MKIQILGAGPGTPVHDKHLSSTYLEVQGKNLLVDCGDGTAHQLLALGYDGNHLDAIIITHYHPDHVGGLFITLQMLYLQNRTKPLKLFLPERVEGFQAVMDFMYTFPEKFLFALEYHPIDELAEWLNGCYPVLSDHLVGYKPIIERKHLANEMLSFSLVFQEENKKVVISSDLWGTSTLLPHLERTDLLIIDALHPEAGDVIRLLPLVEGQVILTHGISDELLSLVSGKPLPNLSLAVERDEIIL